MTVQIHTRRAMLLWIAWSLLAGIGLMTVINALVPDDWTPAVIVAIALAGIVWAARQARWANQQLKAMQRDMVIFQMQADDEDLR